MAKGFKDSSGKFHPTGNSKSSRTKEVRTMGRETSSFSSLELPHEVSSWFVFDNFDRDKLFPRIKQWIDFHSPQDDALEWEAQEMWSEMPDDMRRDILFYYYENIDPIADSGTPRPYWEESAELENQNKLFEEFGDDFVVQKDDIGGIIINTDKNNIVDRIRESGGLSADDLADDISKRTGEQRKQDKISVKLHLRELDKEGRIEFFKGDWLATDKMGKEELQQMKRDNPLDLLGGGGG